MTPTPKLPGTGQANGVRGRVDDGRGRAYVAPDGSTLWPSATTLCGLVPGKAEGIAQWRERVGDEEADAVMVRAQERGNAVHDAIEAGVGPEAVHEWLDRWIDVCAQELTVGNAQEGYAGTADLFGVVAAGQWQGWACVVDWKTGKRRVEHGLQVPAYGDADCWAEELDDGAMRWRPLDESPLAAWALAREAVGVLSLVAYIDSDDDIAVQHVPPDLLEDVREVRRRLCRLWAGEDIVRLGWSRLVSKRVLRRWRP